MRHRLVYLRRHDVMYRSCGTDEIEDAIMDTVTTILAGVAISAMSSWITVQLSLRRFRAEKWWEMRVEAYKRLIEAFHDSKAFSATHLDADYDGRDVPEDADKELRARAEVAEREIARAADLSGFLLGTEVRTRLQRFRREVAKAADTHSWHEYLHGEWKATNSCLQDVIEMARRDLKTDKGG